MTQIPEGAQRSEDGNYWWDGTRWQPVNQQEAEKRQVMVAANGSAGEEVPAPDVQVA